VRAHGRSQSLWVALGRRRLSAAAVDVALGPALSSAGINDQARFFKSAWACGHLSRRALAVVLIFLGPRQFTAKETAGWPWLLKRRDATGCSQGAARW